MAHPSIEEAIMKVMVAIDPEHSNGYGGKPYYQLEHMRCVIDNNGTVSIKSEFGYWLPMFAPHEDAFTQAGQDAFDRYKADLLAAVHVAFTKLISMNDTGTILALPKEWCTIAKHIDSFGMKLKCETTARVFGTTTFVPITLPSY